MMTGDDSEMTEAGASFPGLDNVREIDEDEFYMNIERQLYSCVERGSSVVECRTRNRESPGSNHPLLLF